MRQLVGRIPRDGAKKHVASVDTSGDDIDSNHGITPGGARTRTEPPPLVLCGLSTNEIRTPASDRPGGVKAGRRLYTLRVLVVSQLSFHDPKLRSHLNSSVYLNKNFQPCSVQGNRVRRVEFIFLFPTSKTFPQNKHQKYSFAKKR